MSKYNGVYLRGPARRMAQGPLGIKGAMSTRKGKAAQGTYTRTEAGWLIGSPSHEKAHGQRAGLGQAGKVHEAIWCERPALN